MGMYWRNASEQHPHDPILRVLADRERRDSSTIALWLAALVFLALVL